MHTVLSHHYNASGKYSYTAALIVNSIGGTDRGGTPDSTELETIEHYTKKGKQYRWILKLDTEYIHG